MYNNYMARKLRLILAVVVLILSLSLLTWGLWPTLVETRIQDVTPDQMKLPTPASFYLEAVG